MAKTFKVGDKVRILNVDKIFAGDEHWSNGDITEVIGFLDTDNEYPVLKRTKGGDVQSSNHLTPEELRYIELVDASPTKKQRIKALENEVEALKARIEALEIGISARIAEKKTPNQRRKAVIERAKAFVADVEKKAPNGCGKFNLYLTKPEYHINKEKRIVTVLVKGAISPKLYEKAIARCAPGDVFNEHIGKAIALAKVYGLEIPKEFMDAPQPEPASGQRMEITHFSGGVFGVDTPDNVYFDGRFFALSKNGRGLVNGCGTKTAFAKGSRILDDTEAVYE